MGSEDPLQACRPSLLIYMYNSVEISKQTLAYPLRGVPTCLIHLNQRCCGWLLAYTFLVDRCAKNAGLTRDGWS